MWCHQQLRFAQNFENLCFQCYIYKSALGDSAISFTKNSSEDNKTKKNILQLVFHLLLKELKIAYELELVLGLGFVLQ